MSDFRAPGSARACACPPREEQREVILLVCLEGDGRNTLIQNIGACSALLLLCAASAFAQEVPESENMRLLGYHDLQARSTYQPVIHEQFGRWIAYISHHGGTEAVPKPVNPL